MLGSSILSKKSRLAFGFEGSGSFSPSLTTLDFVAKGSKLGSSNLSKKSKLYPLGAGIGGSSSSFVALDGIFLFFFSHGLGGSAFFLGFSSWLSIISVLFSRMKNLRRKRYLLNHG
jgi:hypothetical protein